MLPLIFTVEIDGTPTVTFEARQLREAIELCKEEWFRSDLADLTAGGTPLCQAASKLRARIADEAERSAYREMAKDAAVDGDMVFAYLVNIDGVVEGGGE